MEGDRCMGGEDMHSGIDRQSPAEETSVVDFTTFTLERRLREEHMP